MYNSPLFYVGVAFAAIAVIFIVASIAVFIGFRIPDLLREKKGILEKKQIEEIRNKKSVSIHQRGRVNVFENLEKEAKVKKTNSNSIRLKSAGSSTSYESFDTAVLNKVKAINPDFIIEKDIKFVSTNEVI